MGYFVFVDGRDLGERGVSYVCISWDFKDFAVAVC